MVITEAARILQQFCGQSLSKTLARIESAAKGLTSKTCLAVLEACGARDEVLIAAGLVKKLAAQVNVKIHASGSSDAQIRDSIDDALRVVGDDNGQRPRGGI